MTAAFLLTTALPPPLCSQTLAGTVLDAGRDTPVGLAAVRLLDAAEQPVRAVLADSLGRFRIPVERPGRYYLHVERIGYLELLTPLLDVSNPAGTYPPIDLVIRPEPVSLRGFTVTGEQVDQAIRLIVGQDPSSLRTLYQRATIDRHAALGRSVSDLIRWEAPGGLRVEGFGIDDRCIRYGARRRRCLPVYLNCARLPSESIDAVPLEQLYAIVPGRGGIHLITKGMVSGAGRSEVRGQLARLADAWRAMWTGGAADGLTNLYTERAVLVPPGEGPLRGRTTIRAYFVRTLPAAGEASLSLLDVDESNDLSTTFGRYFVERGAGGPGGLRKSGWVLTTYRREGGSWRIRAQMFVEG